MNMRTPKRLAGVLLAVLSLNLVTPGPAGAGNFPTPVGTDPAGDWGNGAPGGAESGQDLLKAYIGRRDKDTLEFILRVEALPPREEAYALFAVYEWYFTVDGSYDMGFYGPCQAHAYGDCASTTDPLAFVLSDFSRGVNYMLTAELDYDRQQIVFPIPLDALGASSGSIISPRPATSHDPKAAVAAHTVYFVNQPPNGTVTPRDTLVINRNYRIR